LEGGHNYHDHQHQQQQISNTKHDNDLTMHLKIKQTVDPERRDKMRGDKYSLLLLFFNLKTS